MRPCHYNSCRAIKTFYLPFAEVPRVAGASQSHLLVHVFAMPPSSCSVANINIHVPGACSRIAFRLDSQVPLGDPFTLEIFRCFRPNKTSTLVRRRSHGATVGGGCINKCDRVDPSQPTAKGS